MSENKSITEIFQVIINAAFASCNIIHKLGAGVKSKFKQLDDPVTEIDHTVQKQIVDRILTAIPGIKIVGEEKIDEEMLIHHDSDLIEKLVLEESFLEEIEPTLQFNPSQLTVFIDPLDCTRGFIANHKWQCTVLIGIVYNGTPIMGVIGQPYRKVKNSLLFEPRVIAGGNCFKSQCAFEVTIGKEGQKWTKIKDKQIIESSVIAVSCRRHNPELKKLTQSLKLTEKKCGGSGNKIAMVIRGEVDATIFLNSPISTWDSCAGEAIVLGMGGFFMKPNLQKIEYSHEKENQTNHQGYVCGLNHNLFLKLEKTLIKL